jgi:hypothetical protein
MKLYEKIKSIESQYRNHLKLITEEPREHSIIFNPNFIIHITLPIPNKTSSLRVPFTVTCMTTDNKLIGTLNDKDFQLSPDSIESIYEVAHVIDMLEQQHHKDYILSQQ